MDTEVIEKEKMEALDALAKANVAIGEVRGNLGYAVIAGAIDGGCTVMTVIR